MDTQLDPLVYLFKLIATTTWVTVWLAIITYICTAVFYKAKETFHKPSKQDYPNGH